MMCNFAVLLLGMNLIHFILLNFTIKIVLIEPKCIDYRVTYKAVMHNEFFCCFKYILLLILLSFNIILQDLVVEYASSVGLQINYLIVFLPLL